MFFIFWVLQRLSFKSRLILSLYVFLRCLWPLFMVCCMCYGHQFQHGLFMLWCVQRAIGQGLLYMKDGLECLLDETEMRMGRNVRHDLDQWLHIKSQNILNYGLCGWIGVSGTFFELLGIICLLLLKRCYPHWLRCVLGVLLYCLMPTLKMALALWWVVK